MFRRKESLSRQFKRAYGFKAKSGIWVNIKDGPEWKDFQILSKPLNGGDEICLRVRDRMTGRKDVVCVLKFENGEWTSAADIKFDYMRTKYGAEIPSRNNE